MVTTTEWLHDYQVDTWVYFFLNVAMIVFKKTHLKWELSRIKYNEGQCDTLRLFRTYNSKCSVSCGELHISACCYTKNKVRSENQMSFWQPTSCPT